jgi:hypothetical protein
MPAIRNASGHALLFKKLSGDQLEWAATLTEEDFMQLDQVPTPS